MSAASRPTAAEAAAIAAAIALWLRMRARVPGRDGSRAWSLAMRLPDLEIDELRALARGGDAAACSARS